MHISERTNGDVVIVDVSGKITLGDGSDSALKDKHIEGRGIRKYVGDRVNKGHELAEIARRVTPRIDFQVYDRYALSASEIFALLNSFAAAAVTGGRVQVPGLHKNALQGDVRFVNLLEQMGCSGHDLQAFLAVQLLQRLLV